MSNEINQIYNDLEKKTDREFKRLFIILFILFLLGTHMSMIFEPPNFQDFLIIEGLNVFFGIIIIGLWVIIHLDSLPKNKLIKSIKKMEEDQKIEYEQFDNKIKCKVYNPGMLLWVAFWSYILILVIFIQLKWISTENMIILFILEGILLFNFIIIPIGKTKDIFIVDPRNQTYNIYKSKFIYFHSRKKIVVPWKDTKVISAEVRDTLFNDSDDLRKVEINFGNKHYSKFKVVNNEDYLEIIPKSFNLLSKSNYKDQLIALKSLTLFNKKFSIRMKITWIIVLTLATLEIFFLINYLHI
ncbi:MAG: hypothetical protein ACTSWX_08890 [Promethearchaeota archaeon]